MNTLTHHEELDAIARWREGDARAFQGVVLKHMGLVHQYARRYQRLAPTVEVDDFVQEGRLGLLEAARRFQPERGLEFSSYATYWIKAMMVQFLCNTHGPLRSWKTRTQRAIFFGIGRAAQILAALGEPPTPSGIARVLKVQEGDVLQALPRIQSTDLALNADPRPGRSAEELPDEGPSPEESVSEAQAARRFEVKVGRFLRVLPRRERQIVEGRILDEDSKKTLRELGEEMGVTRERVRQLEVRALAKWKDRLSKDPDFALLHPEASKTAAGGERHA